MAHSFAIAFYKLFESIVAGSFTCSSCVSDFNESDLSCVMVYYIMLIKCIITADSLMYRNS